MIPGTFLTPGKIIHPKAFPHYGCVDIGCYPNGIDARCQKLADALTHAGYSAQVHADVMLPKGAKTLLNLGVMQWMLSPTGEATRGKLRDEALQEAIAVWSALGIEWEDYTAFRQRAKARSGPPKVPAGYENSPKRSSTWQSMIRGTGNIEAEQLNGQVATLDGWQGSIRLLMRCSGASLRTPGRLRTHGAADRPPVRTTWMACSSTFSARAISARMRSSSPEGQGPVADDDARLHGRHRVRADRLRAAPTSSIRGRRAVRDASASMPSSRPGAIAPPT